MGTRASRPSLPAPRRAPEPAGPGLSPSRRRRLAVWSLVALAAVAAVVVVDSGVLLLRRVSVTIPRGDDTLAGTLVLPRWRRGPFPAAVIVHGSGRTRRRDLEGYARKLVPHGLAVLLYDKRGVGRSSGRYRSVGIPGSEAELSLLAEDAAAAVDVLAGRAEIDPLRIGLVGGSQAGWIMPLAAARNAQVRYWVAISGPAVTYGQEIFYSQLTGDDPGPFQDLSDQEIRTRLAAYTGPHGYDPVPVLERATVPSLWILGGADRSVPTELTLANLERIESRGAARFTVVVYPEGDHSIRDHSTGKRIDYWPRIRSWLAERGMLAP